ncbi:location of vulva defective 1-like isoform X2 [Centruroides sculpturatus]|nr:location of vulva defective 1-like isoform X2 [Centruroides sculpturatus]
MLIYWTIFGIVRFSECCFITGKNLVPCYWIYKVIFLMMCFLPASNNFATYIYCNLLLPRVQNSFIYTLAEDEDVYTVSATEVTLTPTGMPTENMLPVQAQRADLQKSTTGNTISTHREMPSSFLEAQGTDEVDVQLSKATLEMTIPSILMQAEEDPFTISSQRKSWVSFKLAPEERRILSEETSEQITTKEATDSAPFQDESARNSMQTSESVSGMSSKIHKLSGEFQENEFDIPHVTIIPRSSGRETTVQKEESTIASVHTSPFFTERTSTKLQEVTSKTASSSSRKASTTTQETETRMPSAQASPVSSRKTSTAQETGIKISSAQPSSSSSRKTSIQNGPSKSNSVQITDERTHRASSTSSRQSSIKESSETQIQEDEEPHYVSKQTSIKTDDFPNSVDETKEMQLDEELLEESVGKMIPSAMALNRLETTIRETKSVDE